MIDNLPEEILNSIFNFLEENNPYKSEDGQIIFYKMDIKFILSFKNVNRFFRKFVETKTNLWLKIENNSSDELIIKRRSRQIEDLYLKKTPIKVFKWILDNNINITLTDIQKLIIKNRIDVMKLGFQNLDFLKTIFNRFTITSGDIFGLSQSINPMLIAIQYDRVEIMKLLLECSSYGNPYLDQINSIFDESIKYTKRGALNYIILNHYEKLKINIDAKFSTIISRFNNIEDILFYIVVNKKANITRKIMISLITKNYLDLFKYCYEEYEFNNLKNNSDLLAKCIEYERFLFFEYLMEQKSYIHPSEFSFYFLSKKKHNTIFMNMVLDKYLELIPLKEKIISSCIKEKVDNKRINKLIDKGYTYDIKDIIELLNIGDIETAKKMLNSYSKS